jgi:phosphoribosylanthranilate isomerase
MVRVKICGITNLEDARNAVAAGCDALGFIFYKKSPRYIAPCKAGEITKAIPDGVIKIGVFVDAKEKDIKDIARLCGLDMLQFHGHESPDFCAKFRGYKIIKAFRVKDKIDFKGVARYKTFAWLFDNFSRTKMGGTGRKFNWSLLGELGALKRPVFLSGGLKAENILGAIKAVSPDWLDISSSVEIRPGKKDARKVENIIQIARSAGR